MLRAPFNTEQLVEQEVVGDNSGSYKVRDASIAMTRVGDSGALSVDLFGTQ